MHRAMTALAGSPPGDIPLPWLNVIWWSGLRGAVSTALALSLATDFPDRGQLQAIVFGVVLFTLVVQATTAELVVGRWGKPAAEATQGLEVALQAAPETAAGAHAAAGSDTETESR